MASRPVVMLGNRRVELWEIGRVAFNDAPVDVDKAIMAKVRTTRMACSVTPSRRLPRCVSAGTLTPPRLACFAQIVARARTPGAGDEGDLGDAPAAWTRAYVWHHCLCRCPRCRAQLVACEA